MVATACCCQIMAPYFEITVLIPLEFGSYALKFPIRLKVSSFQYRILLALKRRPSYVRLLERELKEDLRNIHRSIKSLYGRGLVKKTTYISKHKMGKAGIRIYYSLSENVIIPYSRGHVNKYTSLEEVAKADDLRILYLREYSRAMNMLSSPRPWKQAEAREILKALQSMKPQAP
ncbi:MAG: hypothetical protein QXO76_05420 [Thermoproteota archaeon]